jgi:hypothetical protein
MRSHALALVGVVLLAAAESDPAGTIALQLEVGQSAPLSGAPGANVLCDEPAVVDADFADDAGGFVLHALKPGTTLCGLWLAGQKPGGLYRVTVTAKASDGGPVAGSDVDGGSERVTDGGVDGGPR